MSVIADGAGIRHRASNGIIAFRSSRYRVFWSGQLVTMTGNWVYLFAQQWLVYTLTHSPVQLGIMATLQCLPVLLLSPGAHVVLDRIPRRGMFAIVQLVPLLLTIVEIVLLTLGHIRLWQIDGLVLVMGIISVADVPTVLQNLPK